MTTVQAAEKMHCIGQVTGEMGARCIEKGSDVTMTRGAFCADSREMCLGNADR
jgi:hypothetical protein